MKFKELEVSLENLEAMRKDVFKEEKRIEKALIEIEKEVFGGLTYREHLKTLQIDEVKENVEIKINGYRLQAKYELEGVILCVNSTVYEDAYYSVEVHYPNKVLKNVPKKYEKEEQHIKDICKTYRVINPCEKYKKEYNINYY